MPCSADRGVPAGGKDLPGPAGHCRPCQARRRLRLAALLGRGTDRALHSVPRGSLPALLTLLCTWPRHMRGWLCRTAAPHTSHLTSHRPATGCPELREARANRRLNPERTVHPVRTGTQKVAAPQQALTPPCAPLPCPHPYPACTLSPLCPTSTWHSSSEAGQMPHTTIDYSEHKK